ncbi:heterocyst differentiation protein [Gloeothece citriformis PCC 7424]|uniref:Heterocyst differentiation protein n=1 Tax=Gloeothece citriformis (strain PCC 7424) TaxID=65393 RepID=B7KGI2_GLOC7|nr:HetP family heterocyst commitment protein [Gloeothece citriformis]ACK71909.1 heterocyst differentiation protein [Gloeothece citriformis PCC 7424]
MRQQDFSNRFSKKDQVMTQEQFEKIVEAILAGKYSWACVLILRFAGYNPLHYIPYRTYNRLIKDNCRENSSNQEQNQQKKPNSDLSSRYYNNSSSYRDNSKIKDLNYLEECNQKEKLMAGSCGEKWRIFS